MGSYKIVMTICVPLGGRRRSRVSIFDEANEESEMSEEVFISMIFGSGD